MKKKREEGKEEVKGVGEVEEEVKEWQEGKYKEGVGKKEKEIEE